MIYKLWEEEGDTCFIIDLDIRFISQKNSFLIRSEATDFLIHFPYYILFF